MRICDKCGKEVYTQIYVERDESKFDLCATHYTEFMEWISARNTSAEPARGTRRKRATSGVTSRSKPAEEPKDD